MPDAPVPNTSRPLRWVGSHTPNQPRTPGCPCSCHPEEICSCFRLSPFWGITAQAWTMMAGPRRGWIRNRSLRAKTPIDRNQRGKGVKPLRSSVPLPGAPSIAHFAMGGMKPPPEAQPFCFCCFFVFVVALALACHSERSEEPPHLFLFFAFAFAFVFLLSLSAPKTAEPALSGLKARAP
jgi:hypothetical protein